MKGGLAIVATVTRTWCDERGLRSDDTAYTHAADHILSAIHEVMAHEGLSSSDGRSVDVTVIGGGGEPTMTVTLHGKAVPGAVHSVIKKAFERALAQFEKRN